MAENNTILPHDILAEQAVIGSILSIQIKS